MLPGWTLEKVFLKDSFNAIRESEYRMYFAGMLKKDHNYPPL